MLCIPPQINRKLKEAVGSGKLNVTKLIEMTPDQRILELEKIAGKDYAETISQRFASKFNTELSEEAVQDIVNTHAKIAKLKKEKTFKTVEEWKASSIEDTPEWAKEYVALQTRMSNIVNTKNKLGAIDTIKKTVSETTQRIKDQPSTLGKISETMNVGLNVITSPVYKSLKASADLSYALRQGFKVFTQNPKQWGKSMTEAFQFVKNIGSKDKMDELMDGFKAYYMSHPNYEKLVNDGKLAFGLVEDWFPTTVAERVPALGNIFKSSNDAFTVFSQSARFGIANDLLEKQIALKGGQELTKKELQDIAFVANSITGRGSLGKFEASSGILNKIFFSARYIRSQADTFLMPFNPKLDDFAKKEALKHSVKTFGMIGAILATAQMMGNKVELNPYSSNFGRVQPPGSKRWVDLTAGLGSYISTVAKTVGQKTKSTKTGKVTKLNTGGYGDRSVTDVLVDWGTGKLAPAPSLLQQIYGRGELYGGVKPTPANVARELVAPITADNIIEYLQDEDTATALILSGSDLFGLGVK